MINDILQERKTFAAILMAVLMGVVGVKSVYSQTQVATLKHGEEISAFYGANALIEAYDAAENGDVITLSSGIFTLDSINKAIALHGAGIVTDPVAGTSSTVIASNIIANIDDDASLSIEGILFYSNTFTAHHLSNPSFTKCYFNNFVTSNDSIHPMTSSQFVNCRFGTVNLDPKGCVNSNFINCVIWNITNHGTGMSTYNSFVYLGKQDFTMSAYNCIVIGHNYYDGGYLWHVGLNSNSYTINCIGIGGGIGASYKDNCWEYNNYTDVFESYNGNPNDCVSELLILKEEIASTCIGMDGSEVGIYGGTSPYTPRPSYMKVRHCTVGDRTTDDG